MTEGDLLGLVGQIIEAQLALKTIDPGQPGHRPSVFFTQNSNGSSTSEWRADLPRDASGATPTKPPLGRRSRLSIPTPRKVFHQPTRHQITSAQFLYLHQVGIDEPTTQRVFQSTQQ